MKRLLLFLVIVLALCVGGGLALRTRALPEAADSARIEAHLAEEIAMLHQAARDLIAKDLRFPRYDHEAGHAEFRKRVDAFQAEAGEIKAVGKGLRHPALVAARVLHREGGGNRFEVWILGDDQLGSTWSISPSRASPGKPSVRRVHGGDGELISYSAVGPSESGSSPGIELLLDLDWLVAQGVD